MGVASAVFQEDSATFEVLQDINHRLQQQQQQQKHKRQQKQQQLQQQRRQRELRPQLPVPLLHPCEASQLLGLTSSTTDVDLLLLSQLYQPGGLAADDMVKLVQLQQTKSKQQQQQQMLLQDTSSTQQLPAATQQQYSIGSSSLYSSSSSSSSGANPADVAMSDTPLLLLLPQLDVGNLPQFPPRLRADIARAAVASYLRHGAHTRAAAIAHAAAVTNPRDIQQFHLLFRGCAAAGEMMPALVLLDKLRGYFWQAASPKAQAAMLR
jgi:hypothetical protein